MRDGERRAAGGGGAATSSTAGLSTTAKKAATTRMRLDPGQPHDQPARRRTWRARGRWSARIVRTGTGGATARSITRSSDTDGSVTLLRRHGPADHRHRKPTDAARTSCASRSTGASPAWATSATASRDATRRATVRSTSWPAGCSTTAASTACTSTPTSSPSTWPRATADGLDGHHREPVHLLPPTACPRPAEPCRADVRRSTRGRVPWRRCRIPGRRCSSGSTTPPS